MTTDEDLEALWEQYPDWELGIDWATGNMDWSDVQKHARRIKDPAPADYDEAGATEQKGGPMGRLINDH